MPTILEGAGGSGVSVGSPFLMWLLVGAGVLAGISLTVFLWSRARHHTRAVGQVSPHEASGSGGAATALDRRSSAALVTLDDAEPETEAERTAMQWQILELCARADTALDQQTVAFDELQDLHRRAPELLDETGAPPARPPWSVPRK